MSVALAVQMKGLGDWFMIRMYASIAPISFSTLVNTPRRERRSVSSVNRRSIRFSHELDVGV